MGIYKLAKINEQGKWKKDPRYKQSSLGTAADMQALGWRRWAQAGISTSVSTQRYRGLGLGRESLKENSGLNGDLCEFKWWPLAAQSLNHQVYLIVYEIENKEEENIFMMQNLSLFDFCES